MGSQTLEILRQGVWASLTGGWFYDPHQNVFCNAVHLYIWLFLLCMPFITYLYFTTYVTWSIYCVFVAVIISILKILNLGFHSMYDEAQAMSDVNLKTSSKALRETSGDEDAGIEMQVLGSCEMPSRTSIEHHSDEISCANSAVSNYFQEPVSSTIVDVHRKNSSESSDSIGIYPSIALQTSIITHNAEVCSTVNHRRQISSAKSEQSNNENDLKENLNENSRERGSSIEITLNSSSSINNNTHSVVGNSNNSGRSGNSDGFKMKKLSNRQNRHESFEKDETKKRNAHNKLQRQISLDSDKMAIVETSSKLQRHRSSDDQEDHQRQKNKSNVSLILPHHHHHHHHHHSSNHNNHSRLQSLASDLYLENNYTTKSELAIENIPGDNNNKNYLNQKSTPMRRDSNSTMSALQLPTASSSSSSRIRRHSNASGKPLSGGSSVRRIKSAALETCCAQPSTSNLQPHPNSIEAIGGQILRNPQHTVLPPPSKSLSRNPHLNLFPKQSGSNLNNNLNDPVYPIEEQADEGGGASGRSLSDDFTLNQNSDSDDDDDDDDDDEEDDSHEMQSNQLQRQSITESESDLDRLPLQSTDSDTENNGSRSPLLEVRNRLPIFVVDKTSGILISGDKKIKLTEPDKKRLDKTNVPSTSGASTSDKVVHVKSEESEGPSSDGEQASAGSKDMLLTEKEVPQYVSLDLNIYKENNGNDLNIKNNDVSFGGFRGDSNPSLEANPSRSLGAIPKSRTRSRRFSSDEHWRPTRNIVLPKHHYCLPQTPTPVLTFLNSRTEHPMSNLQTISPIYPSTSAEFHLRNFCRRPRTYAVLEPNRHRQPKIRRSTRSKHQQQRQSIDSETLSKEDIENNNRVAEFIPSYEKIAKRINENSVSLDHFMDSTFNYDVQPTPPERTVVQLLSVSRVDFNDPNFPDYCRQYITTEKPAQPKRYYRFPINFCGSKKQLKISMDRLQLLALFDRDNGWIQVILAIILSTLVSVLGSFVLHKGFYDDIFAFIFCFVIAGSQYSLLKSVQPDAASPIHGFNKTVAFSRPIYFCICTALLLLANHINHTATPSSPSPSSAAAAASAPFFELNDLTIFGFHYHHKEFFSSVEYVLTIILLLFPIFFSLGLFPQINTFLMYLLEQVDMHIFGGNAVCSLLSAFISIVRSILACLLLYGPAFGGLSEKKGTQHVLFSIYCSLLLPVSYHLSRSASDFSCIWNLIKSSVIFHPDDDDIDITDTDIKVKEDKTDKSFSSHDKNESHKKSSISSQNINNNSNNNNNQNDDEYYDPATAQDTSNNNNNHETELIDPLPKKLQSTVNNRLKNDLLICTILGVIIMSLHSSTIFTVLQPDLNFVLYGLAIIIGVLLHYIVPQLRKHLPWLCIARPILRQHEHGQFEAQNASKVMWFEKTYIIFSFLERNVLYPLIFLSALTADSGTIAQKYGISFGAVIVVVCGLKCIRSSYSDPSTQYIILIFTVLFFRFDFKITSETFLIDYFLVAIIFKKTTEFLLKMQFVVTYIAPWQITWGSAFHAFAQPFSVPHSAMLFLQAAISAILSTPLNPFLGSAIFLTSYVRPIKFWERDYNTRRIDHSNTRLSSQLERDLGADDNNLNSIFYEHLTRSLQHSLCGDLLLGRWGNVSQGDCFVLASDYLNCLVHIIELGNGLCTFQMRGLEFRGTYCQQREVEAISEGVEENDGCCCCSPGHLPRMLSANAMFSTRWLAWQVIAAQYVLEGYSISDNSAVATLQVFEFRKVLITYYVKSIIYYTIRSPKLLEWLQSRSIQDSLQSTLDRQFVDLDPIFNHNLDDDYDFRACGVTRNSFCSVYLDWIQFCCVKRQKANAANNNNNNNNNSGNNGSNSTNNNNSSNLTNSTSPTTPRSSSNPTPSPRDNNFTIRNRNPLNGSKITSGNNHADGDGNHNSSNNQTASAINTARDSPVVTLCLALALLGRRTLATASHSSSSGVEFFLHGLHALFKGDFRITSPRDEWVFADMELLHGVVAPAVRMSLKLHQDHFLSPDEYEDPNALYKAIDSHTQELVISHEADPLWRNAVLRGAPNLLALRHVMEDGSDEYRVIRLTKRFLSFRVIKLNRECVRGLWAGQQQELIYLRNRNPERGSIQNAKQALRNIINSSCDQPIGYPIYVSPLTTSYAETNEQLCNIVGGSITLDLLRNILLEFWNRVRRRCREGCSSGSGIDGELGEIQGVYCSAQTPSNTLSGTTGTLSYGSQSMSLTGAGIRGSLASMSKPTSSTLIAGLLNRDSSNRDSEREPAIVTTVTARERSTMKRYSSRSDRERRATLPVSSRDRENAASKQTIGSTNSSVKLQESVESCNVSPNQKSNNSSFVNLNATNNNNNNSNSNSLSVNSNNSKLTAGNSNIIQKPPDRVVLSVDETDENHHNSFVLLSSSQPHHHHHSSSHHQIELNRDVIIYDVSEIYDCLDLGRRIDVIWPSEKMRSHGGRSSWKDWTPGIGMIGKIVHYWQPNHSDCHFRSNVNRTILLIQIGDRYVPIGENGVKLYFNDSCSGDNIKNFSINNMIVDGDGDIDIDDCCDYSHCEEVDDEDEEDDDGGDAAGDIGIDDNENDYEMEQNITNLDNNIIVDKEGGEVSGEGGDGGDNHSHLDDEENNEEVNERIEHGAAKTTVANDSNDDQWIEFYDYNKEPKPNIATSPTLSKENSKD